jgi:hypothetical protein
MPTSRRSNARWNRAFSGRPEPAPVPCTPRPLAGEVGAERRVRVGVRAARPSPASLRSATSPTLWARCTGHYRTQIDRALRHQSRHCPINAQTPARVMRRRGSICEVYILRGWHIQANQGLDFRIGCRCQANRQLRTCPVESCCLCTSWLVDDAETLRPMTGSCQANARSLAKIQTTVCSS